MSSNETESPRRSPRSPGWIGSTSLLATISLIAAAVWVMRSDPRFIGAAALTVAVRTILTQSAMVRSPEELFDAAAAGMTSTLDPFSSFMPPTEYDIFTEETEGQYVGIGVEIKAAAGEVIVVHVFPQSPAADALIRPGDRLIAVDSVPVTGLSLIDVTETIRGPVGAPVTIQVQSRDDRSPRTLTLVRRTVPIQPFPIAGVSQSGVAYVRWDQFSTGVNEQLASLVQEMSQEEPTGLICDLRGNPGGLLDEAVAAAGIFLPENTLVCELVERDGTVLSQYRTEPAPHRFDGPLVLILDENSASASEVFAAALQESGRAAIVGRRSFGKGWVQSIFEYGDDGALRLSTARYRTPGGQLLGDPKRRYDDDTVMAGLGLEPDVLIAAHGVGPWLQALSETGALADFALTLGQEDSDETDDELPDDDWTDRLRDWAESLGVAPRPPLDPELLAAATTDAEPLRARWAAAFEQDADLLFERERGELLLHLWEQRLLQIGHPDPGELETYIDLDADLSAARDLLEEPERYAAILAANRTRTKQPLDKRDSDVVN